MEEKLGERLLGVIHRDESVVEANASQKSIPTLTLPRQRPSILKSWLKNIFAVGYSYWRWHGAQPATHVRALTFAGLLNEKVSFWLLALVLSPVAVLVVITPMDSQKQYIFGLLSIGILFLMGFSKRRSVSVIMVVTSLLMSTRYMYFRLTQTLHFNSSIEAILGMGLFLAEVYIWVMLLLNYLQTVWPLKRGIVPLPDDMSKWPTVDIYIPSYNEPLEVVRDTVPAAQCIDYPKDKMKIYLLDDGKRSEFAVFAADVGVGYITRNDNKHAKAGNLNHALTLTQGSLSAFSTATTSPRASSCRPPSAAS